MSTDPVIIALDVPSATEADAIVDKLGNDAGFFKVGMELYAAAGMDYVRTLLDRGKRVFLDLKFHDIGETVKRAVARVASSGVTFLTVHAQDQVVRAAAEGRGGSGLKILAVTVLTSLTQHDLDMDGHPMPISDLVQLRVRNAVAAGADGLVMSSLEVTGARAKVGGGPLIVVPGVRSPGVNAGDQKRVATPAEAMRYGANYMVIGRQVTRAEDPASALDRIRREIA